MKVVSGANGSDPSGHRQRLLELHKNDLVEEVVQSWDALANSEAELSEVRIKARQLEVEIAKLRGVRGVSSTKVEMAGKIEDLENEISILSLKKGKEGPQGEELIRLRKREETLLTALLDLEREFVESQSV